MVNSYFWAFPTFFLCLLFGLFAGQGAYFGMAALIGFIAFLLMLLSGVRIIAYILLIGVPTIIVFPNTAIQALPFINTERLLFACIIGLITLNFLTKHKAGEPLVNAEKFALAFLAVAITSYFYAVLRGKYSPNFSQDAFFVIQYVMGFSGFIVARRLVWSKADILRLIDIMLVVGIFMTGQAIVQYFFGMDIFVPNYLEVPHAAEGRATGTFANSSEYGAVAATILLLGIYRYSVTKNPLTKALVISSLAIICIAIFLSKTRAPWLAVAMSVVVIAYIDKKVRTMIIFNGISGVIVAIILLPFFVDLNSIQERFTSLIPIYNRVATWVSGISMGLQNPLLGVGFGSAGFKTAHPFYTIDIGGISAFWQKGVGVPHNEFVHIFALSGFTGLIMFLATLKSCFNQLKHIAVSKAAGTEAKLFALYGIIILLNWFLNGLFVDTGAFWYLMFLVFFTLGCAISYAKHNKEVN